MHTARERRYEVDVAVVVDFARQRLDVGAVLDEAEIVAQPLDQRARDRDGTFERVAGGFVAKLIGKGRQETGRRRHGFAARVHEHEAAGSVGVLRLAGFEAGLTDEGGLLIAEDAGDSRVGERADRR